MTSKNLVILGATGHTGQQLVRQALDRRHHVTALVRDPAKITIKSDNLAVVTCDIFDKDQLLLHIQNSDVVLSTLGFKLAWSEPVKEYLEVAKNISQCMLEAGKRRAIFMHSWYTDPASISKCPSWLTRFMLPYVIGQVLAGMRQSELFLETQEHLDFTCILPPALHNEPVTDRTFIINDTEFCVPVPECSTDISRSDVARYMLDIIDDEGSYRKIRAIGVDGPAQSLLKTLKEQMYDCKRQ